MPTIDKPSFPTITLDQVGADIDQLKEVISQSTDGAGKVDVTAAEERVRALGNDALEEGFEAIKDAFERVSVEERWDSCAGAMRPTRLRSEPKSLDSAEVMSVLEALGSAKAQAATLDQNGDGTLQAGETQGTRDLGGLDGDIAGMVVDGKVLKYRRELNSWRSAINQVLNSIDDRQAFEGMITSKAAHHAETDLGSEAVAWFYRLKITQGVPVDRWSVDHDLEAAETSWLRNIPLFGRNVHRREGHLADAELEKLFGTDDLSRFISETKLAVSEQLGGKDYFTGFLEGADLPTVDPAAEDDPDFYRDTSRC